MSLNDLYQETILDHGRKPRNRRKLDSFTHEAQGHNPLCGDEIHLRLNVKDGVIVDVAFEGCGCAISTASASLMTMELKGRKVEEAEALFEKFQLHLRNEKVADELGEVECLVGVAAFPERIKCAILPWHAFRAAMAGDQLRVISTEGDNAGKD